MSLPRETRVSGKTVTDSLAAEFKAADEILKDRLDNLAKQLAEDNGTFVSDYTHARVIVDMAASRGNGDGDTPAKDKGGVKPQPATS